VFTNAAVRKGSKPFAAAAVVAALGLMGFALTGDAEAQILGAAESFAVLAGSTVTNTGPSVIHGDVGVSPGNAIVGFPPGIVVAPGTIHAGNATAANAQAAITTAYNTLMAMPTQFDLTGQDLGGKVLTAAVYNFASSAQLTGVLTLNGQGNTASQFVFKIGSALTTASNSAVLLINGANGNNVYWAVGSSATLGTNSLFTGNIVALTSITLTTGASIVCGRALARNGAVTLDTNTITLCAAGTAGGNNDIPLNVLFGEGVTGAQQTAIGASRLFGSTMMSQAAFWRDGAGNGQDLNGITPQNNRSMKDAPIEGGSEGIVTTSYQPRTWRMWTTGFGGRASLDGDAERGTSDLQMHTAGFAVGLDVQIDRSTLFGIAGGCSYSGFSVDQRRTTGTVEGAHVGLYGVKRLGSFYLATTAEYARFFNKTDRFIDWVLDERAWGRFNSEEFSARLEAGWQRSIRDLRVTPFAGLDVSYLRIDRFSEESARVSGGPGILGLTFGTKSVTSLTSSLGIQLDKRIPLANGQTLTPFARVAWTHEFNPDRSVNVSLTSSPEASFSPYGAAAPGDAARVNAGLKLDVTKNVGLYAFFDGEFSGHSQSYAGNGGVKISW
jgi:outer membrane autotransporter protein